MRRLSDIDEGLELEQLYGGGGVDERMLQSEGGTRTGGVAASDTGDERGEGVDRVV